MVSLPMTEQENIYVNAFLVTLDEAGFHQNPLLDV
jgi:hypothetical protein